MVQMGVSGRFFRDLINRFGSRSVSLSERKQELKRRRHRKKKLNGFARKLDKANVSEKAVIAEKLRRLTPGCEVVIEAWELEKKR
jgi:hypothetical protein